MKKLLRLRIGATALSFLMATLPTACTSVGDEPAEQSALEQRSGASYGGRELYLGMFFGEGEAAKLFPEIWQNESVKARLQKGGGPLGFQRVAVAVADQIEVQSPAFFEKFAKDLQSGQHLIIEAALKEAREHTRRAAETLKDLPSGQLLLSANSASDVYLYWETAVAVAVVVIAILFAIDITPVAQSVGDGKGAHLTMDEWVDLLAHKDFGQIH